MASSTTAGLRLASAPLEVLGVKADESIQLHAITSGHPVLDDEDVKQPALRASCYVGKKLVLALTPFADSNIVEVRSIALDSTEQDAAPHHVLFPSPLLPDIHLQSDREHGVVLLQACTVTGYVYRIRLVLRSLSNITDIPESWVVEQKISAVSSDAKTVLREKTLSAVHCSADGQVTLISCSDGRIVKLVWEQWGGSERVEGAWRETVMRASTFFGRFFARGGPSSGTSSPVLSMQTFARSRQATDTLAFTVSQDRRLRIWDIGNESCVRTIDLPTTLSQRLASDTQLGFERSAEQQEQDRQASTYDRPTFLRVISTKHADASSPYSIYLIVALPPSPTSGHFLACYGVQFEAASSSSGQQFAGSVGDIDLLWQKGFDARYSFFNVELRDVLIHVQTTEWSIWCVWDAEGKTVVQSLDVKNNFEDINDERSRWASVALSSPHSALHGQAMDRDLDIILDANSLGFFVLDRVSEANRFTLSALDRAIRAYKDSLLARGEDPVDMPPPGSTSTNMREQILALVGCTIHLQRDPETGADLHEQYLASLKREWAIFLGLLAEIDADERWPVGFVAPDTEADGEIPFVVSRGWLSLPVQEDKASALLRIVGKSEAESVASENYTAATLAFGVRLRESMPLALQREFDGTLLNVLASQSTSEVAEAAEELWSNLLQKSLTETEEALAEDFSLLGNEVLSALEAILGCISGVSSGIVAAQSEGHNTEVSDALVSDTTTQAVADRLHICKVAILLTSAISAGYFELPSEIESSASAADLLTQLIFSYQKLFSLDLIAHYDGVAEVQTSDPELFDGGDGAANDPDLVAKRIGNLHFGSIAKTKRGLSESAAANVLHKAVLMNAYIAVSSGDSLSRRISSRAYSGLYALLHGSDEGEAQTSDMSSQLVLLADAALRSGHPTAVVSFVGVFPHCAAGDYLVAKSLLSLDDYEVAADLFESVLDSFEHWSEEKTAFGSGLALVLPSFIIESEDASAAAFHFCRQIVSHFKDVADFRHVIRFSLLALRYAAAAGDHGEGLKTRDLHLSLFRSCVDLQLFDDAYVHLLAIPFDDLQRESLRTFISIMCEGGRVQQLLSYNFAGLQSEVERTLSFKARNSDPLSEDGENYYNLLYAFHTRRGDLKSAGATMWQMGARINESYRRRLAHTRRSAASTTIGGGSVRSVVDADIQRDAIVEARCYLASVNALSLIDVKDAWFAHEIADEAGAFDAEGPGSRLTTFLPSSAFQQRPREIRIVSLDEVRRRYQLLLAQLELISLYPDEIPAIISNSQGDGTNAVILAVRNQDYELAFSLAHTNALDRTEAYISLTDKCLELTRWEELRRETSRHGDSQEEHPLMKALYDDQSTIASNFSDAQASADQLTMPSARFLDQSDRCVMWTGSVAQRAWRYLRLWLGFEGESKLDADRYRIVVINRILDRRLWRMKPHWLLESVRTSNAEALINSLLDHDLLVEALQEARKLVEQSTSQCISSVKRRRVGTAMAQKTYLPYLLFDVLLKRSDGRIDGDLSSSSMLAEQEKEAKALRQAVETHKDRIRSLEKETRANMADDDRRARRLRESVHGDDVEMNG